MSYLSKEPSLMIAKDFKFFSKTKCAFKVYRVVVLLAFHAGKKNENRTISNHT